MTLVVGLGINLCNYENSEERLKAVRTIVESGCTDLIYEVFNHLSTTLDEINVLKVERTVNGVEHRWLTKKEAQPIIQDIQITYEQYDYYASFAWFELDEIGAFDIQELALTLNNPEEEIEVKISGVEETIKIIDLERSSWNWQNSHPQAKIAFALHQLAMKHRLMIHSL